MLNFFAMMLFFFTKERLFHKHYLLETDPLESFFSNGSDSNGFYFIDYQ